MRHFISLVLYARAKEIVPLVASKLLRYCHPCPLVARRSDINGLALLRLSGISAAEADRHFFTLKERI
jgi:hypothetical protein